MNEQRREKALKILELAMTIDDESTKNKSYIHVDFAGNICWFGVKIYLGDWSIRATPDSNWCMFLDDEQFDEQFDDCLAKLAELHKKLKDEV